MSPVLLLLLGVAIFAFGYLFYSKFLSKRIYRLDSRFTTPAHELRDNVDYVPTNRFVLWGHHFTSVAGAAPIVGPAIAMIWGWLPAFLWVTIGTVFFAGMHDLGSLWASTRNRGQTIAALSARYIGRRGAALFLLVIFILGFMVIAAFSVVITDLLVALPSAVIPSWGAIGVALLVGVAIYRRRWPLIPVTIVGVAALYSLILLGDRFPVSMPDSFFGLEPTALWIIVLLVYCGIASVLPVWVLLQPRDYINGVQLFIALILLYGAVITSALFGTGHGLVAPAINTDLPAGTPSILPLLFVTIACGAISGFHGVIASGTTAKQLNTETDARFVGYFGAVGEGMLALGAILAIAGGYRTVADWEEVYSKFGDAGVQSFVEGGGMLLETGIGLPAGLSATVLATMAVLFAATTLDSVVRLMRYVVQEIGGNMNIRLPKVPATLVVLVLGGGLTFSQGMSGEGGMRIWPLFGTTNQLLAALTLIIIAVVLIRKRRNPWPALIPLAFVFVLSFWAAIEQLVSFADPAGPDWLLLAIDIVIIGSSVLVSIEGIAAMRRAAKEPPESDSADAELAGQQR